MLQTTWQTGHQRQLTARKALSRPWRGSRGGKHRGPSPPWNMERLQSSVQSPPQPIRASYAIMGASWPRLPPRPSELHRLYVCGRDSTVRAGHWSCRRGALGHAGLEPPLPSGNGSSGRDRAAGAGLGWAVLLCVRRGTAAAAAPAVPGCPRCWYEPALQLNAASSWQPKRLV